VQGSFNLIWKDPADDLVFNPPQATLLVIEGQSGAAEFKASNRHRRWFGNEQTYPFSVQVTTPKGETLAQNGEVVSRGIIPPWVIPIFMVLCLLLAGAAVLIYGQVNAQNNRATQTAVAQITYAAVLVNTQVQGTVAAATASSLAKTLAVPTTAVPSLTPTITLTPVLSFTPTHTATVTPTPTSTETPTATATLPPGAVIDDFTGTWVNSDPNTSGMTKLVITKINPSTVSFHGFGACSPTDCDWSSIAGSDVIVPFTPYTLSGTYDFGFEKTTITVFRQGSQLKATVYYQYTDSTKNTTETYLMNHSSIFIPPILIHPTLIFLFPSATP